MELVHRDWVTYFETDQFNHMNVKFYVAQAESALKSLTALLGYPPSRLRAEHIGLHVHHSHIRYLKEQFNGTPLSIYAGITNVSGDELTVYLEMQRTSDGSPAATFTYTCTLADLRNRAPLALTAEAREKAAELSCALPEHAKPRGLVITPPRLAPTRAEAIELGLPHTFQRAIRQDICDEYGFLTRNEWVPIIAASTAQIGALTPSDRRPGRSEDGGATMEYRWVFHKSPRAGDIISSYSAQGQVTPKSYNAVHWFLDGESGEAFATGEAVFLTFDQETRKSKEMDPERRKFLENEQVPGMSV